MFVYASALAGVVVQRLFAVWLSPSGVGYGASAGTSQAGQG